MNNAIDLINTLADRTSAAMSEFNRRGQLTLSRTHAELHERSMNIAAAMREAGIGPGAIVFVQLPNGCSLVEQFFAAIFAGALPCCLAPPRALGGIEGYRERMKYLFDAFPGCMLITDEDTGSKSGRPFSVPFEPLASNTSFDVRTPDPEAIVFLQLTSGTSRSPKAVRISHRALTANIEGMILGAKCTAADTCVSWLPLYHDMGLVGMVLATLGNGSSLQLFRPDTFAARPYTWLKTISDLPGTGITTAPNFAYQHCVNSISPEQVETLDLSRWRVAGCGAERVRSETMQAFIDYFAKAGFDPSALTPCYGMAETTLAVTFDRRDQPPKILDGVVSCGRPLKDTEIVIRDLDGNPLPDGESGEITVRGPGLFSGYTSITAANPMRDGWLHTGDIGLFTGGELFVSGRLKNLIILDGQNLDPTEIEAIAEDAVTTRGGRYAAFPTEVNGRERVVLAVEVPRKSTANLDAWSEVIDEGIASHFGFRLHELFFVARGHLPTTSSGKVRRSEARRMYEEGEFTHLLSSSAPKDPPKAAPEDSTER